MKAKEINKTVTEVAAKETKVGTAPVADVAAIVRAVEEKEAAKVKKTAKTVEAKATVKKETVKKAPAKKAELKTSVTLQFYGKSYTQEDLMKIAKDVWKFDLKKKVSDLKSVELYVKPEENVCYYVMNGDIDGSFSI